MKESSNIKNIEWIKGGTLRVEFKSDKIYEYKKVPKSVYTDFMNADSLGKFFTLNIKNKFVTEKLESPEPEKKIHGSNVPGAWPFPLGKKP